ncbi:Gar1/Naf1 RNA binding region-domain-containing protein [Lasiosphaeria hispida]|uniref:H/ACA ribonucleoprotein complex non-core subunit NAF1 n=1 Tax=Lasiosphaeria hispida TaxID=260671 RepID=A0AAJ0MDP0_9PEZI|nr:Gar1/Naf1 RNA binding region-domain-containing protein [Lasiosphaeria hispida]
MSDQSFQIPGLGQAKPNEQLPIQNFAPDLIAAAASISDDASLALVEGAKEAAPKATKDVGPTAPAPLDTPVEDKAAEGSDTMDIDAKDAATATPTESTVTIDYSLCQDEPASDVANHGTTSGDVDMSNGISSLSSPDVTSALEAALNGMIPAAPEQAQVPVNGDAPVGGEHPEWEEDSSPYESSSESESSDSSSDDDSEDEGGYALLGIEETARMLMAEDADADGDGDGNNKTGKGAGAPLRTKNEIPDDVLPKPDITITPEMKIEPLGNIQFIVENTAVIQSQTPGEVQVLERGSVLCKENRSVVGALTDILGNVRSPVYILRFSSEDEIKELGLEVGAQLFYSVEHAVYAFTQVLKEIKGCDASNLHDEEVGQDEMEFSDDEKEAEYKRQHKLKKRTGRGGRGGREQGSHPHPLSNAEPAPEGLRDTNLNYDEDEDGPYKPLSRPSTFAQGAATLPPKPETGFSQPRGGFGQRGAQRGGRGDFRGRGRGGSRGGDRKFGQQRGRGGNHPPSFVGGASPPGAYAGPSALPAVPHNPHMPPSPYGATPLIPPPPPPQAGHWPPVPGAYTVPPPPIPFPPRPTTQGQIPGLHQVPPPPAPNYNYNFNYQQAWPPAPQGQQQYQYGQTAPTHHQAPPQPPRNYSPASQGTPPAWPAVPAQTAAHTGAYVNPAFYGAQPTASHQQQQQYWNQQGGYGQGQQ